MYNEKPFDKMTLDELIEYEMKGGNYGTSDLASELALRLSTASKYLNACIDTIEEISDNENIYLNDKSIPIIDIKKFISE